MGSTPGEKRLAVRFAAELRNDSGSWFRAYGCEEMELDDVGLVRRRFTCANEHAIQEHERMLRYSAGPRPAIINLSRSVASDRICRPDSPLTFNGDRRKDWLRQIDASRLLPHRRRDEDDPIRACRSSA